MKKEEKKSIWYWIFWIMFVIIFFSYFLHIRRIDEPAQVKQPDSLKTLYLGGENYYNYEQEYRSGYATICCPVGYVRTGCNIQKSISSFNGVVYPTDNECCTGYKVYFWTICLKND